MKAVVIDDFRLARLELIALIQKHKDIVLAGECDNGNDALALIQQVKPDVVFTDINMPGLSVFEFLESVDPRVQIVFTTSYADYALKAFGFNTVDYLLKPISQERFDEAVVRLRARMVKGDFLPDIEPLGLDSKIMVKGASGYILRSVADIIRFETREKETLIYFSDFVGELSRPLSQIELRLPEQCFFRVSRQAIVNIRYVVEIQADELLGGQTLLMSCGTSVPITRRQFSKIRDYLII